MSLDLPPPIGTLLAVTGGTATTLKPATARVAATNHDATQQRAPFGADWWVSGSKRRGVIRLGITLTITGATIDDAANPARAALDALDEANSVITPYGLFRTAGLQAWAATPVEAGYRVDAQVLVLNERPEGYLLTYAGEQVTTGGDPVAYFGG